MIDYEAEDERRRDMADPGRKVRLAKLKDGDKNWEEQCLVCEALPTVHPTQLCGPCCFGEADTIGGNW